MNEDIATLVRELDESRLAMRRTKEILIAEANPVQRIRRTWITHKPAWIGAGIAAAGLLALLLARRRPAKSPVPPGYIIVAPAKPLNRWWGLVKFAVVAAKPAVGAWLKWRSQARS